MVYCTHNVWNKLRKYCKNWERVCSLFLIFFFFFFVLFCFFFYFVFLIFFAEKKIIDNNGYRPYAYDVTEGRPAALGVKQKLLPRASSPSMQPGGANPASHTAGLARPGPRTERLSANAHCQHNTCALRDTRLASLLWRCDPLWRQCIRSIVVFEKRSNKWPTGNPISHVPHSSSFTCSL